MNPSAEAAGEGQQTVVQETFVDTLPGAEAPEGGEAQAERQGGRRRSRRGGRGGRDRDEAGVVAAEGGAAVAAEHAEVGSDVVPAQAAPTVDSSDTAPDASRAESGEANGDGRRRGRGRDRNRRERSSEGSEISADGSGAAASAGLIQGGALAAQAFDEAELPVAVTGTPAVTEQPVAMRPIAEVPAPEDDEIAMSAGPTPHVAQTASTAPTAPATLREPMPTVAPVTAAPAFEPAAVPAAAFVLPLDSLQAVAESAGLQWVNSDAEKIRAVQATMAAERAAPHVPRERKAAVVDDTGPLVMIETRKDLSQIKLPFETARGLPPQV